MTDGPGRGGDDRLLEAIDLALADRWDEAHAIVQDREDATAAWIHAVLHKIEGDDSNALYWYRRAGRKADPARAAATELREIRATLAGE
jgi:hypothetical protein